MASRSVIKVGGRHIGAGADCFVIAEAGVNHNGDVGLAHRLIDAAAQAGADAVKFQTFEPASLASAAAPTAPYQEEEGAHQREMLARLALNEAAHVELQQHAKEKEIIFFSSPFDERSADLLDKLGVPAFKVASGEVTNHPFLRHVAQKARPLLMSTGMCTLEEVAAALAAIAQSGNPPVALFHCLSSYPADPRHANLRAMETLRTAFGVPVGWSDHTPGVEVSIAAAALGAELIEKHLTLDRRMPGPDHRSSLEPEEFGRLVAGIRLATGALGDGVKRPFPEEHSIAEVARKSLHWRASFPAGTRVTSEHFLSLRPGVGIPPSRRESLAGRRLAKAVVGETLVSEADFVSEPT